MWNLLNRTKLELPHNWHNLEQLRDIENALMDSQSKPVVLFKHSTRCGISLAAYKRLASNFSVLQDSVHFYYLDLLQHRSISNALEVQLGVVHQSPQIIVISKGEVVFDASHDRVTIEAIIKALQLS